jgi:poly-gamma-glutamate capsule biosynthesis protein CapA/YwtB (metallophosphatase superfamily)
MNYLSISTAPRCIAIVEEVLAAARAESDLVIFSIPWGPNMRAGPTPAIRTFARRVIEVGADVFWGHSAHVVQGIEVWNGRPIFYDTSDFIDDHAVDPTLRNDRSALFLLRVAPPAIERIDVLPVEMHACQVNRAGEPGRAWFARWLKARRAELGSSVLELGDGLTIPLSASRAVQSVGAP